MTPIQTVALVVRLFAIWLAIYVGRWAPWFYVQARDYDDNIAAALSLLVAAAAVFFVLFLWFFPKTVARTLLPPTPPTPATPVESASPDTWFAIGCSLLGIWTIVQAIPRLGTDLFLLYYSQRTQMSVPENWASGVAYCVIELAIGIWLLLGASGLRRLFWWARNAGDD